MEILKSIAKNKKAIVNAMTTSTSIVEYAGQVLKIDEIFIFDKDTTKVAVFHAMEDGAYISSTSTTVIESLEAILSFSTELEVFAGIEIEVCKKQSKNKRDFFYLALA